MASGFVKETDLDAARQKRQEEWERVRQADQPEVAPEEPYDARSLFDRLQEQKNKKQSEWDESHKLKNQVRGIDSDEANFLDQVDAIKWEQERKRIEEEKAALEEYRKIQEELLERQEIEKRKLEGGQVPKRPVATSAATKQSQLLSGVIVRKRSSESCAADDENKKVKSNEVTPVQTLGALAGLGSYESDEDEESS